MALIDADEADHQVCRAALGHVELPLITTWPAFTEAMYLLSRGGGPRGQDALWRLVLADRLRLLDLSRTTLERSAGLMAKYEDLPMDLADATLVAVAEDRGDRRVFTLDRHFQIYRLHGRRRFDVVPGLPRASASGSRASSAHRR